MQITWQGVYPALTTKFTSDDKLDFDAIGHNYQAQLDAGVNAFIISGSLGEASTLEENEKFQILKTINNINYLDTINAIQFFQNNELILASGQFSSSAENLLLIEKISDLVDRGNVRAKDLDERIGAILRKLEACPDPRNNLTFLRSNPGNEHASGSRRQKREDEVANERLRARRCTRDRRERNRGRMAG